MPATPAAPVPFWLRLFAPNLEGLEANPLYLRISGAGFARGPRWNRRWPMEISTPSGIPMGRLGCLPFAAILWAISSFILLGMLIPLLVSWSYTSAFRASGSTVGAAAFMQWSTSILMQHMDVIVSILSFALLWGIGMLLIRLAGVDGSIRLRNFLLNGSREPWGEALCLTGMAPRECDRALIAGLLGRQGRFYAVLLLVSLILGLGIYAGLVAAMPGQIFADWAEGAVAAVWIAPFAWIELAAMAALLLAFELRGALRHHPEAKSGGVVIGAGNGLACICALFALHAPGVVLVWLWSAAEWSPDFLGPLIRCPLFTVPSAALMAILARNFFARYEGALTASMFARIYMR